MDKWNIGYEGDNVHIVIPRQQASDLLYALTLGLGGNTAPVVKLQPVKGTGGNLSSTSSSASTAAGKAGGKEGAKGGGKSGGKGGGKSGGKTAAKTGKAGAKAATTAKPVAKK